MATRILYVITKANWGGAQRYVYDLAVAALDAKNEIAVAYGDSGELTERLKKISVPTTGIHGLSNGDGFFASIRALFTLIEYIRIKHPHVVHLNSSKAGMLGVFAARISRVPKIIFTAHGWAFNELRPWWQKMILYTFAWVTVILSHQTICVSSAVRRDIAWMPFVKRKLTVIHNGISCGAILSRDAARAALAPRVIGNYWIGMVSELHPTKRVEDAIRAMQMISKEYPGTILVILGEGRERQKLEDLIRELHVRDHVFLAGFHDAAPLLSAFDLFVHSSQSEALGYVILEAGCASLPVVATRVGGIPEIIPDDDHGLLVPACNPKTLAVAIESLIKNPSHAHELGARLHARVQTEFSKEKMLTATLALYP